MKGRMIVDNPGVFTRLQPAKQIKTDKANQGRQSRSQPTKQITVCKADYSRQSRSQPTKQITACKADQVLQSRSRPTKQIKTDKANHSRKGKSQYSLNGQNCTMRLSLNTRRRPPLSYISRGSEGVGGCEFIMIRA